jgi:hypothetical protein
MGSPEYVLKLSKFDVAERQLLLAIRLFFSSEDDVSIHTLSEAAGQILHDIGKDAGVWSIVRDSDRIRPEYMKEWHAVIFKSRNFFKHADRDRDEIHEFKSVFNDMSILDAVNMYSTLKKCWTPETLIFIVWFGLEHPDLVKKDSDLDTIRMKLSVGGDSLGPTDKAFCGRAITALRSGTLTMPNITLGFGLAGGAKK